MSTRRCPKCKSYLLKETGTGKMIFNWFEWKRDGKDYPKIHPTQKPVNLLKQLITIFTDEGDVVIDPVCGSGSTLRACEELGRKGYGFEIKKDFYNKAMSEMLTYDLEKFRQEQTRMMI